MSPHQASPRRIVIPLANPRTAADLVRIGAALMEHDGTLTCLSIVEVPEGMALSEGATRARQSRRLLQRVLRVRTEGVDVRTVVRIARRAAEGIVEAGPGRGSGPHHLRMGRPASAHGGRDAGHEGRPIHASEAEIRLQPNDRRSCPRRPVRYLP